MEERDFKTSFELSIEILANLAFLTKLESGDQEKVVEYMRLARLQLEKLADMVSLIDGANGSSRRGL